MSCDDPNCPTCLLIGLFADLKESGASLDDILGLCVSVVEELYGASLEDIEEGTMH